MEMLRSSICLQFDDYKMHLLLINPFSY
jgi:hypothetical protein